MTEPVPFLLHGDRFELAWRDVPPIPPEITNLIRAQHRVRSLPPIPRHGPYVAWWLPLTETVNLPCPNPRTPMKIGHAYATQGELTHYTALTWPS